MGDAYARSFDGGAAATVAHRVADAAVWMPLRSSMGKYPESHSAIAGAVGAAGVAGAGAALGTTVAAAVGVAGVAGAGAALGTNNGINYTTNKLHPKNYTMLITLVAAV